MLKFVQIALATILENVIRTMKTEAIPLVDFVWRFIKPPSAKTGNRSIFKCVSRVQTERDLQTLQRTKATGIDELPHAMPKDCTRYISRFFLCYSTFSTCQSKPAQYLVSGRLHKFYQFKNLGTQTC